MVQGTDLLTYIKTKCKTTQAAWNINPDISR